MPIASASLEADLMPGSRNPRMIRLTWAILRPLRRDSSLMEGVIIKSIMHGNCLLSSVFFDTMHDEGQRELS
jgi:hypothetical protein